MPKSVQDKAKQLIHEMYLAPTRKAALAAYDQFISSYQSKFPKACECLEKDKEVLFTFYDFPAQHWPHLRTTNPIESTFASGRLVTMNRGLLPWGKISALPITRRARLQLLSVAYSNCTKLRQGDFCGKGTAVLLVGSDAQARQTRSPRWPFLRCLRRTNSFRAGIG